MMLSRCRMMKIIIKILINNQARSWEQKINYKYQKSKNIIKLTINISLTIICKVQ